MEERALLVGINKYPGAPLHGCVNDVNDMADFLVEKHGFKPDNVRLLVDGRATTKAILERLDWLRHVEPGGRAFFHFSGHGVQYPTRDYKHEIDGQLEAVCPVDFDWSLARMIVDKQFVDIFSKIPKSVKFAWVNDSCHSGDLTRNMPGNPDQTPNIPRAYPVPADIAWRGRIARDKRLKPASRAIVCGKLDVGFVSACRSDQVASDTAMRVGNRWRPCGALTHYLLDTLKQRGSKRWSLKEVVKRTREKLRKNKYQQIPQAEGNRVKKPFLS